MIYIQYEADDHTLFTGHVRLADNSFDLEVEGFAVRCLIRGLAYNITESLSGIELANFKREFLEYARLINKKETA